MDQKRKVYAVQIAPEYQDSPWDLFGYEQLEIDKAAIWGNCKLKGYTFSEFIKVVEALGNMDWDDVGKYYDSQQGLLLDYVPPVGRDMYTDEEIAQWKTAYDLYNAGYGRNEQRAICMGLTLMMGKEYDYRQISGCCQSDWNYFFYPTDLYNDKMVRVVETEYFNTGEEWTVHEANTEPESPNDVQGYSIYVYDDARKEIAESEGVDLEDVILWAFDGWRRTPKYQQI